MMNRPRPRKIINVIKTSSPSSSEISEEPVNSEFVTTQPASQNKPASPVVPQYSSPKNNINADLNSSSSPSNFVPRKPVVATLRKMNVPPPPTFSDSPKSSPSVETLKSPVSLNRHASSEQERAAFNKTQDKVSRVPTHPTQINEAISSNSPVLSPKSSGEAFLDAADKAADFIGGALLSSFKSFNLSDTSTVKFKDSDKNDKNDDDNPFADIMKKLKSPVQESEPQKSAKPAQVATQSSSIPVAPFSSLMDEEPPESFNSKLLKTDEDVNFKVNKKPLKRAEPSSFIKAAFSPKEQKEFVHEFQDHKTDEGASVPEPQGFNEPEAPIVTKCIVNSHTPEITTAPSACKVDHYNEDAETLSASEINSDILLSGPIVSESINSEASIASVSQGSSGTPLAIPFFDSFSSINSVSPVSAASPRTGFRASILKHGLSALEKIGKSTADVVVSTRNKLANDQLVPMMTPSINSNAQVITPDYSNESASFYEILKLYGGYSKLQELQLRGVRASIATKLARRNQKISKFCTLDHQRRLEERREISTLLHPDRIMESIDDYNSKNSFNLTIFPILASISIDSDELICIQKLLKSLDNILIVESPGESVLIPSNKRRHAICQVATVLCGLLIKAATEVNRENFIPLAKEVSLLTAQIIKYLQTNFGLNCESTDSGCRADRDQQVAIKLFLDISYSIVPQLQ